MSMTNPRVSEHVEELIALSADLYWEQDAGFRFTFITSEFLARNGVSPAEMLGKTRWEHGSHNMHGADWDAHRAQLERHEAFRDLHLQFPATGGGTRWVSACGTPRFGADGTFAGYRGLARDITQQKQAETFARDGHARLELVLDSVPALIARLDTGYRIVYANRAFAESLGTRPEALAGRRLSELVGAQRFAAIESHATLALAGEPAAYTCAHGSCAAQREYEFRLLPDLGASGTARGVFLLGNDVTEAVRFRGELLARQAELRTVLDSVPGAISHMATDGRILYVNEKFASLYGRRQPDLLGRNIRDVVSPKLAPDIEPMIARVLSGEAFQYTAPLEVPGAGLRTLRVRVDPERGPDGRVRSFFALATDVTEIEQLHRQLSNREAEKTQLLEGLGISVNRADPDERLTYVNRAFAENQGQPEQEVIGLHLAEVASAEVYAWYKPLFDRAMAGEQGEYARWVERPGRGWLYVLTRVFPEVMGGKVVGVYGLGIDITAQQEAQEALRAKEQEMRHLLDSVPAVVAKVTNDERYAYANEAYAATYGLTAAGIVGRTVRDVIGEAAYLAVAVPVERAHAGKRSRYDSHSFAPDGTPRTHRFSLVPDRSPEGELAGTYVFGADVTELHRANERLVAMQDQLNHVLESVPLGIARIDSGTTYTYANPELSHYVGLSPAQIVGHTLEEVLGADLAARLQPNFDRARAGEVVTYERDFTTSDGEVRWLQMTLRADPDPATRGVFAVAVDITERRRQEARTAGLLGQLQAANEELESFSYTVSHDLRAPLRAISGFASILNQDAGSGLSAQARHYLARITSNAGRMTELIEGLLRFSQLARQELLRVRVSPETIVAEVIADHEQDLAARDIRLTVGTLPECLADPLLLKQVYANLISNAFKYTARRAVAEITIGSEAIPEGTAYFVADNGAGFDPAYADKLFGVFQRLHSETEFAGSGVGLATAKRIIGRHGGRLWAVSEVGRGARFSFTLGA